MNEIVGTGRPATGSAPRSSRRTTSCDEIVGAGEIAARAERPGDRRDVERERLLDLVEKIEGIAGLAVELVDEGHDRHVAQPAHLEQLAGPRLDALGGVDHHDGANRRR